MLQPSSFTEPAIDSRPTPTSLRWNPHSRLLELYKLIVGKEEKEPYFQLFEGCAVTNQTPARVYLDYPKAPKKGSYPCQYPWGCSGKQTVFTRPADLDRHYKNVHASPDQKDSFPCDYAPCGRHLDPFTRKDHYRDHLRDYHKEDLGCAKMPKKLGRKVGPAEQAAWLSERKVSRRWWRCARCLVRRQVQVDGWECPNCKSSCEQDRIDARLKKQQHQKAMVVDPTEPDDEVGYQTASSVTTTVPSTAADPSTYYECGTCREYSGWVYDGIGEWNECPDCTTRVAEASYPVDDYYQ
ncbi:uncharacterized protein LY89DRAFT_587406 [Mollisia scopiformis]|uniref:C2H2-type domain-containing protein n=1 Tax=Mollisia scopiformis TaxID=149040 RepID=A0A194X6G4_MOLSC|nr:uncharacterized protein LY89DRAFT_587406 [Mollisia scopiformis]KUJ15771.1 hypothetical protein LY89DRAFT_587406 [Mollisia scopiformis]